MPFSLRAPGPWPSVLERLRQVLKEPFVQFLLLGGILFLLHPLIRPPGAAGAGGEIAVTNAQVARLVQTFARTWQRPPTEQELQGLIDDHIRTEVFVREAMALGLDRDDVIVRRRLRQKMEFISKAEASIRKPSASELRNYLEQHSDRYRSDPVVSFQQVFLDPEQRGDALDEEIQALLQQLNEASSEPDLSTLGDRLAMLGPRWSDQSRSDLLPLFGGGFTDALLQQQPGRWVGPITSAYGVHLVRVERVKVGTLPDFLDIQPQLERDWNMAHRRDQEEAYYRRLLRKYTVQQPELNP
jgi:hypothetical protein